MKKKILIATYDLEVGGVERSLISMLDQFDYDQFDVDLLLYHHSGDFLPFLTSNVNLLPERDQLASFRKPISHLIKGRHPLLAISRLGAKVKSRLESSDGESVVQMQDMWKYSLPLLKSLDKEYDVAISFLWPHDYVAYKVKAKSKIAWIHTDYSKIKTDTKRDLKVWNQFNHIISISEDVTTSFLIKYPSLEKKILLIENIISPDFIKDQANEEIEGFNPEDFNLVSVGRLCYAKGYDHAIKALRKLHDEGFTNIKWHIIGYGSDESMLKELIKEHQLEKSFILHGKKINPYPYMKAADVYVQPSRYEGKAVTVSEAKILGKAVLITNYDTAHSQLEHGVDGYITDLSINGIVNGVKLLYSDYQLKRKLELMTQKINYGNRDELQKLYVLSISGEYDEGTSCQYCCSNL